MRRAGWLVSRPVEMAAAAECDSLAGFICAVAKAPPTAPEEWMEGARKFFHANHDPHRKSACSPLPSLGLVAPVQQNKMRTLSQRVLSPPGAALHAAPREFRPRGLEDVPRC